MVVSQCISVCLSVRVFVLSMCACIDARAGLNLHLWKKFYRYFFFHFTTFKKKQYNYLKDNKKRKKLNQNENRMNQKEKEMDQKENAMNQKGKGIE